MNTDKNPPQRNSRSCFLLIRQAPSAMRHRSEALKRDGLTGLIPQKPGPHGAHKLTASVLDFLARQLCSSVAKCASLRRLDRSTRQAKPSGCWHPQSISSSHDRPASVCLEPLFDRPAALATGAPPPQPAKVGLGLSDFIGPAGAASVFQNPERISRAKPFAQASGASGLGAAVSASGAVSVSSSSAASPATTSACRRRRSQNWIRQ